MRACARARAVPGLARSGLRFASAFFAAALVLVAAEAPAALPPIPESPTRWVTDQAGLLSPSTREALDARLEAYERSSGHQVIVYIAQTTGGWPLEEFCVKAFEKWRPGRKGLDDGVVLFVFTQDRRLHIEVGYGLEGTLPDIIAGRIVRDQMVPLLAAGKGEEAITTGVDSILSVISGSTGQAEASPGVSSSTRAAGRATQPSELGLGQMIVIGIIGFVFLVILVTHPRLALWILFNLLMSGRGGGSFGGGGLGGGGGGFSGGGGRSGGGGASGSW